jgi:hypothetical protein
MLSHIIIGHVGTILHSCLARTFAANIFYQYSR